MEAPTEQQLLEEVRRAFEQREEGPDDAMTTKELAKALGITPGMMLPKMRQLAENPNFECVTVMRPNWHGQLGPRPAIRLKD